MKKLKKIILSTLIGTLMFTAFSAVNIVKAESAGPIYLGIVSLRKSGYGYKQNDKKVWKIAQYNSTSDTVANTDKLIYCIKAGAGFGSENSSVDIREYNQKFDLRDVSSITEPYSNPLPTGENYNKLMWVIDNMYTKIGEDNATEREAFLSTKIPNEFYELLTDDDIDVIQQLAIWYFTNPEGTYHYDDIELKINSIVNDDNSTYKAFEDLYTTDYKNSGDTEGVARQNAAKALYSYYITNADANYVATNTATNPISLEKSNASMQVQGEGYVAGPYKIVDNNTKRDYSISATYKNYGTNTAITPTLGVKDSSGKIVATNKTLQELVGQEFYLMMPTSSKIAGIEMTIVSTYSRRTATYWSVKNAPTTEQPVVIVEDAKETPTVSATIVVPQPFDLALRKFITAVNGVEITNRIPTVDVTALAAGTSTTAVYNHTKDPVRVEIGDIVTYTIRVYNEGKIDGYVEEITDHLPEQLEFIVDDELNQKYGWALSSSTDLRTIKTSFLSVNNETTKGENKLASFDGTNLDYRDVKVRCKVVATENMADKITNIADITKFTDGDGNTVTDRDSQENNVTLPTGKDLENYKDQEISRGEEYIPGQQDDDDFEKLILKKFDLSLRKFITGVNDKAITSRIPKVDVTALAAGTSTTATYNHSKEPVAVSVGDTVIYTIRVYNEGEVDGYANEITDHLPDQLEFLPDNEINKRYGWTVDAQNSKIVKTKYLSKDNGTDNLIQAFDGQELKYKDVQIACKVVATNPMPSKVTNIADITDFVDKNGNTVTDRDSEENNVEIPSNLPDYKDDEINKDYVPGQEDDDDFEKVIIKEFDLALRKFITKVNNTDIKNRYPVFSIDSNGKYTYNHTKDPVMVSNGCIVTYTIRVYNEGNVNGYASLIKDDIPEGLEFLPDNETNKEYRWILLDSEGNETTDATKAVSIATDYLSKDQEKTAKENLLKAFDPNTMTEPDHKDVKVAFKVVESNTSDRIIINKAQISDDSDEDGNEIKDKDSIPDEWNEGEDDQDIEKIKVQYFDLALRKWVTQAIVIDENGQETVTETGHKAEDDPEELVKVDLKKSKINKVTVKFRYSIRVTNEGQIPGYVKEIKDYIPEGLKFVQEDNPQWTQIEENIITTDAAKDILLQPGESTEVEVLLTWINSGDNLGKKVNVAEISKDYNEFEAPDIDSTPDNQKPGEDDIDDEPVILSVQTGEAQRYIGITAVVLVILAGGITLIKKFVL